jgi:tetratricopeptide (TPR) repeat protein
MIASHKATALTMSSQEDQALVIRHIVFPGNVSFPHLRTDIASERNNPLLPLAIGTSEKSFNIMALREAITRVFNTMFRAVGLTGSSTTPFLVILFITIFLIYRARIQAKLFETTNILREELSKTDPDFKMLQEKIRETGLTPEQAAALLDKGSILERGLAALGERKFDDAIARFTEVMREISDAFFYRAIAYFERGDYEKALEDLDKFLELNPDHASAWDNRGVTLERLGRYEEALGSYDKAIELNPTHANAWYNRGVTLESLGRHEEALSSYDKAIELNPTDASAWNNRGVTLERLGRYEEALSSYDKAIELNPTDADALNGYAWILIDKDIDIDEGVERVKKALVLSPDDPNYEDTLAWGLYKRGRYKEALELLQKAANRVPDNEEITQHLAEVKAKLT